MDFYLGLTGLPGTGKEAVSKLIASELAALGIQTLHYSLSGPIAVELQRRGLPPDREQYRAVANEVRANLGNGAWAARTAREIHETLAAAEWRDIFIMIDGVRNPAEVAVFKELWGDRFHLLAVSAPEGVRLRNLTARSSPKDAAVLGHLAAPADRGTGTDTPGTDLSALAPVLTAEMGIGQPQHGTNVLACIELADWTLENTEHDASMTALRVAVHSLVERLVLPLYRRTGSVAAAPAVVAGTAQCSEAAGCALVVESDGAWQTRLADLLEQEGCDVEFAADYAAASQKLLAQPLRHPYHLLVVDLHLPGAGQNGAHGPAGGAAGFDLLQSLHYFGRSLPTILVAAEAGAAQVGQAFRDFDVRDYFSKQTFVPQLFRSRVRSLLQAPYFVVAALDPGSADYLVIGRPYRLAVRVQRDAPQHKPPLGDVLALRRPCTAHDWPVAVVLHSRDLLMELQPVPNQQFTVPANYLAEPLIFTIKPLAAGNGRLELEFHQPGQFVERLTFNAAVRVE